MVYGSGDIVFHAKRSNQRMQWMQSHSGHSRFTVVYVGGDIVFDAKMSNQWMQWMQSHSGLSTQWSLSVDAVCSGCSTQ